MSTRFITNQRILRLGDVEAIVGIRRSSIYAAIRRGDFPEPLHVTTPPKGHGAVGWLESEVTAWIDERAAQRHSKRSLRPAVTLVPIDGPPSKARTPHEAKAMQAQLCLSTNRRQRGGL